MSDLGSNPLDSTHPSYLALTAFLDTWRDKDWEQMANQTQLTWRSHWPNAAEWLNSWFGTRILLESTITSCRVTAPAMREYRAILELEQPRESKHVRPILIGETGPMNPHPDGMWGVNPISVLRGWAAQDVHLTELGLEVVNRELEKKVRQDHES